MRRDSPKRKAERKRLTPALRRQLEDFYGEQQCVLNGGGNEISWHHLDENPSLTTFENLVPLRLDTNANIEQRPEIPELAGTEWREAGRRHERYSRYPLAYGAARTGAFLEAKRGHATMAMELAADCIRYLRPLARLDLVADVLKRNVYPLQNDEKAHLDVSPLAYARFCDEIANLFREHGSLPTFRTWFGFTLSFLERLPDFDQVATLQVQSFRHQSFAFLERGGLKEAEDWMSFAEQASPSEVAWREAREKMSQELWAVRAALRSKDYEKATERLQRLEKTRRIRSPERLVRPGVAHPSGVDIWMEGSLQGAWAEAESAQGRGAHALERVHFIRPLYQGPHAIVPTIGGAYPIVLKALEDSPRRFPLNPADRARQMLHLEHWAQKSEEGVRRRLSRLLIVRSRPLPDSLPRLPG